jgi:D-inositol-3-phosphate glycosyltransferase
MNVYIAETSRLLAQAGVEVEIFTRATSSELAPVVELSPGVTVRHVSAGPFEGLSKNDLPAQMCAFTAAVLRAEALQQPGWYDIVHSHYWLSGQVGWLARDRWGVPLVHTAHTLAKAKNARLALGDVAEPMARVIGEEQVVAEADRLIANTDDEARQLIDWYAADPSRIATVPPGVDLDVFRVTDRTQARERLGLRPDAVVLLFVGRLQPLKAPDVLLKAAALLASTDPVLASRMQVLIVGAPSGNGLGEPDALSDLAVSLGIADSVRFHPPVGRTELAGFFAAADITVVPSYNESFGLVALESQACGTPVLAAAVGGLPTAVRAGVGGVLVESHQISDWADALGEMIRSPGLLAQLAAGARPYAEQFSWSRTASELLATYAQAMAEFSPQQSYRLGRR